jgi:hypothetical protein
MISKPHFDWFWAKICDAKRGGATHTRVASFKMAWLILDIESCGGIDRIDVSSDVHVKVSHAEWTVHKLLRDSKVTDLKKLLSHSFLEYLLKKDKNRKKIYILAPAGAARYLRSIPRRPPARLAPAPAGRPPARRTWSVPAAALAPARPEPPARPGPARPGVGSVRAWPPLASSRLWVWRWPPPASSRHLPLIRVWALIRVSFVLGADKNGCWEYHYQAKIKQRERCRCSLLLCSFKDLHTN